jgi:hypothetical protein
MATKADAIILSRDSKKSLVLEKGLVFVFIITPFLCGSWSEGIGRGAEYDKFSQYQAI